MRWTGTNHFAFLPLVRKNCLVFAFTLSFAREAGEKARGETDRDGEVRVGVWTALLQVQHGEESQREALQALRRWLLESLTHLVLVPW